MSPIPRRTWRHGLCLLAVAAALLSACASDEERFAEHMQRAEKYDEEGNIKESLLEYRSALKINPQDPEVNNRIADLARRAGAYHDAAFFYREAYRLDPTRIQAAMDEAQLLLFTDPDRAAEIVEEGMERFPDQAVVHIARSQLALIRRNTNDALTAILTGAQLAPDDPRVWMQVGFVHLARIREQRLVKHSVPDDSIFRAAIKAFDRADELSEGSVAALIERARTLGTWPGHLEEAEAAYRHAVARAKEIGDRDALIVAASSAEEFANEAKLLPVRIWALREIVSADEARLSAWDNLARLEEASKKQGESIYRELLEKRPEDPLAHGYFAGFLVDRGRSADAVAHLTGVIEGGHGTPTLWEQVVRIELLSQQLPAARATYVRMAETYPNGSITQRTEARIALAEGRPVRAGEILRVLAGKDESFETQRLLASAEYRLGNLPAATAAVDRALSLSAGFSADAVRLKVRIHHDAEDWGLTLRSLRVLIGRGVRLDDEERLIRARALYETGRSRVGRQVLEILLAEDEPPPPAAVEYARREGSRTPQRARTFLVAAWKRAPLDYDVLEQLMKLELAQGQARESLLRLNEVIGTGRAGPKILLLRAEILARTGALDRAEADALRAFEASPQLPKAVDLLVAIYTAQGRLEEAQRSFEEAEAAGVLHSGARLLLGRVYLYTGETAKAEAMFEKVLAEQPGNAEAKNDLAFLLAGEGRDLERALRLAQEAQRALGKSSNAADTVGYVFYRKELYEAALQQFRYALELAAQGSDGPVAAYHYHMGLTLRALGRDQQAARSFETALELDSDFPNAEDARRQLEAARSSVPGSPSPS